MCKPVDASHRKQRGRTAPNRATYYTGCFSDMTGGVMTSKRLARDGFIKANEYIAYHDHRVLAHNKSEEKVKKEAAKKMPSLQFVVIPPQSADDVSRDDL